MTGNTIWTDFNPRPPRGGRPNGPSHHHRLSAFQSTPPARGATSLRRADRVRQYISIHAPREGGDAVTVLEMSSISVFQSTPPARGATLLDKCGWHIREISIHAPREGGDEREFIGAQVPYDFNPRPPRGGRHRGLASAGAPSKFQSTPPARGATAKMHSFTCGSLTNK